MTHVVVATNNVTLRADDVDWKALQILAEYTDKYLEDNREVFAKHIEDLMFFGHSILVLPQ